MPRLRNYLLDLDTPHPGRRYCLRNDQSVATRREERDSIPSLRVRGGLITAFHEGVEKTRWSF